MKDKIGQFCCTVGKALGSCQVNVPPLEYTGEMDIYEVSSILLDRFPGAPLYLPDYYYKTCSRNEVQRFLDWDMTSRKQYESEYFDCDDFSWRLKGNITVPPWSALPFFVVWTDVHALNGFIDDRGEWWFVEPQNNAIQSHMEAWQGNEIRFIGG